VLSVLLAPACAACGQVLDAPTEGPVCAACWAGVIRLVPPLCDSCGNPLPSWRILDAERGICPRCRRAPRVVDRSRAVGEYEGSLRDIIHAFKYDSRTSLARRLGAMMRAAGDDVLRDASCAIPIPLHPWRRLHRGFNQATELAQRLHVPVVHALWRRRATVPQSGLTAADRRRNVREVFVLSPWVRTRAARLAWLEDRCVVLVDDVRTTGATLDACARVLKGAGAREVRALTIARAAPPRR
jgi:ComF family protein